METAVSEKQDIRILVVDDESRSRNMFERILAPEGYTVDKAESGERALSLIREKYYNVIVSDLMMPGLTGTELIKLVKRENSSTEVIIVTGYGSEKSAIEAVRANAFDYLHKPLADPSVLVESVRFAVEKQLRAQQIEYRSRRELMELNRQLDIRNRELQESNETLKNMQSQLLQQEKMAAIGQLAAGVAHEINNPIGFIHSNLGTLKRYVEKIMSYNTDCDQLMALCQNNGADSEIAKKAEEVLQSKKKMKLDIIFEDLLDVVTESQDGTERVRKIVADLKSFSRMDEGELEYADINDGLESTLGIVWNELKYKAVVNKEFGELPHILCYPQQLNQVFMNILVNAGQAIEEKGEIDIKTFVAGEHLYVEVRDTGTGIPDDVLPRLFDPFFTTKPAGKGTGLGLSIAYEIIDRHDGTIEVTSKMGQGTTFLVKLPIKGVKDGDSNDTVRG